MKHMLCAAAMALTCATNAYAADAPAPPPTRADPRLMTLSGTDCAHGGIPEPGQGAQMNLGDTLAPALAMEVYDALTGALDEAGRDKERVSSTVLNLIDGQPRCFQVAMAPQAWRSTIERRRAEERLTTSPIGDLITEAQAQNFPFFVEFYIRRRGNAIAVGVSGVRYREAIWRNFQSPANNIVATLIFSNPGNDKKQEISIPLGGPTRSDACFNETAATEEGAERTPTTCIPGYRRFTVQPIDSSEAERRTHLLAGQRAALEALTREQNAHRPRLTAQQRETQLNALRAQQQTAISTFEREEAQARAAREGGLLPTPSPQSEWFTSPFGAQTGTNAPTPVTISIRLRELKDGNPVAAALAGALTAIRGNVQTEVSPTARAQAAATQRAADITSLTAYGAALNNYITAHNNYCAPNANLAALAPALYSTHTILLEYVQAGMGAAPPFAMVDVYHPDRGPCPSSPPAQ